jgi:Uncharacterized protein conserved in bacteria (DUF2213)
MPQLMIESRGEAIPAPLLNATPKEGWPREVDLKFIVPGLVRYEDLKTSDGGSQPGDILVDKDFLDKIASTLKGKPIVNWDHRYVDPKEFDKGTVQGIVTGEAYFDASDGWYHAPGLVWNKQTLQNIERGFSISCAYQPTAWDQTPGTLNKVPYLAKLKDGYYTHIAVVDSPRYEGATIELRNSNKGGVMSLFSIFRGEKKEEKVDIDTNAVKIPVEGHGEPTLEELINNWKKKAPLALKDDEPLLIDGRTVTLKELKNEYIQSYEAAGAQQMKEAHEIGKHSSGPLSNCAMCNSEEKERKDLEEERKKKDAEETERKNKEEEEKKKKEDDEKRNAADKTAREEAARNAQKLDEARNSAGKKIDVPKILSIADREAVGLSRYGRDVNAPAKK